MARLVEGLPDAGHARRHARRGLVVDHEHGAELVGLVGAKSLRHAVGGHAGAVGNLQPIDLDAVSRRRPAEVAREVAVHAAEDAVARGERVDHGGLPAARPRARVDDRVTTLGPEDGPEPGLDLAHQRRELRSPVVDDRLGHGPDDTLGHEGGARNLEERSTGHDDSFGRGRASQREPFHPSTRLAREGGSLAGSSRVDHGLA